MSWVVLALVGAAVLALVNMFDKTVHGYSRTPDTLPLFIGVAQTTIGVVVLALVVGLGGIPDGATWSMTSGVNPVMTSGVAIGRNCTPRVVAVPSGRPSALTSPGRTAKGSGRVS